MKPVFIAFATFFLVLSSRGQSNNFALAKTFIPDELKINRVYKDSSNIRIINGSSLKRLPSVIEDLFAAFNGSMFQEGLLLGKKGITIYLYDVKYKSFEISAAIQLPVNDTIYYLKLNWFNQQASDMALAATLIHEIMHCVLIDIYNRALRKDERAHISIINFGLKKNDTSNPFNNDFFYLMNIGENGQHELMYQLFYPYMVSLLNRFALLHKESLFNRYAEKLMWSGLQRTDAYMKLSDEEREDIESAIFSEKRIRY